MTIPMKLAALLLVATASAEACTIPVFRYALDRWWADTYGIVAEDAWKKGPAGQKADKAINESNANLVWAEMQEAPSGVTLLWPRSGEVAWTGELDPATTDILLASPVREKIAKRVLAGESAVWVMVEGGDKARDKAFADRLKKRLKYLESVAAIPPQDPNDPDSRLGPGPDLKVGFSMIRVSRKDPKERFLVQMLAGPEGGELLESKEPFAGPVFARGRVLGAWKAEDLDDAGIDEVSLFLLGACSCRVKAMNPGWDLLMAKDWDGALMEVEIARTEEAEEEEPETPEPAVEPPMPEPAP